MSTTVSPLPAHPGLTRPGEAGYDEARAAWNLAADLRPGGVITARTPDEVVAAMHYAAEHGLRVAPTTTGHLAPALEPLGGALLLRTAIGGVEIDATSRIARVGAGAIWQDVVEAAAPHGLAALSGSAADVGVVGYVLGGGLSWLSREHGLACNHVRAVELVVPGGELVRCDAEHHPELFWALRGGGGNFGVVTHIELGLLPLTEVFAGMTVWPAAQAREVLAAWARWSTTAPREVTTSFRLLRPPADPSLPEPMRDTPLVVIDGCALGDRADELTAAFRGVGTPIVDTWATMEPAALLEVHMDPPFPVPGISATAMLDGVGIDALDSLLDTVDPAVISPLLTCELRQLGGRLSEPAADGGATERLAGEFALFALGMPVGGPEHAAAIGDRLSALRTALAPWSRPQAYLNFSEQATADAGDVFDPQTLARLARVRADWDPRQQLIASHPIGQPS